MKKDLAIIFGLFLLIAALLVFGKGFSTTGFLRRDATRAGEIQTTKGAVSLTVKTMTIEAQVAQKASQRKVGLAKRDLLPLSEGILFVFESPGKYGIWMKDMKFAIDIIWIDENKKIVDVATNVPPEPDKKDRELTIYRPSTDAKYVLEVNAGLSALHDLKEGDLVNFQL